MNPTERALRHTQRVTKGKIMAVRRVSNRDARASISARVEFTNATTRGPSKRRGTFRGVKAFEGRGHLPEQFVTGSLIGATYVVYSYDTPLAWYGNGSWFYASVAYSPTTSEHQHIVRLALVSETIQYVGGDWRDVPDSGRFWDGSPKVNASTGTPANYYGFGSGDAS